MNNLKNYSKPVMLMEQFVPEEYVAGCWKCVINCIGTPTDRHGHYQIYVFNANNTNTYLNPQMTVHDPHTVDIVTWRGEGTPPDVVPYVNGTLHEFEAFLASQSAIANDGLVPGHGSENQHALSEGYAWSSNYGYCFATVLEWVEVKGRPNAS